MRLSINWLKDYLLNQDLKLNPKEIGEKMTMRGLAVESIGSSSRGLNNVVVGKIEKIDKHPNADRLQVTSVRISKDESVKPLQIVCGAKNISVGDVVPVALIGAVLPGDFKIKESKIRGVDSFGMICSGKELELSEDTDGILQLPKHSSIGDPLAHLVGSDDSVLEFDLTANRGDCLSILGLAREIAPTLKTRIRDPKPARFKVSSHRTSSILKVEVPDATICPRYTAVVIDNLKVTESPEWIQQRLKSVGLRPINNIVDITNFVMLEYGQPLHAFDLRKIESGIIKVAACERETDLQLLTGESVQLQPGDILIQDGDKPIALAGIMGGASTGISAETTSIILESATFNHAQIRKTAKRLGLHTDSSKRFERKVDFMGVGAASERAASLLRDSFDGNVYYPPIDTNAEPPKQLSVSIDMRDVRKVTGLYNLSSEKTADLLESIGITTHKRSANILVAKIPSFRNDLEKSVDMVEEVARLIGYEIIPERFPVPSAPDREFDDEEFLFELHIRHSLAGMGMRECIHYSFTSENNLIRYGVLPDHPVRLSNPISDEFKVLRPSLLPSLLETYRYNRNRNLESQRLFEVARTYLWDESVETTVKETSRVAGLLSGMRSPQGWVKDSTTVDFYTLKGLVENLISQNTTVSLAYEPVTSDKLFFPNRSAVLKLGTTEVGFIGEIHPHVREGVLETDEPLVIFELNLDVLRKYRRRTVRFKKPSKFPAVSLDIAITVDKSVAHQSLIETIRGAGGELLDKADLFDVYAGENIPMGKRSLAFHLSFLSSDRTLEEAETETLKSKIIQALQDTHGAQLRA